MQEKGNKNWEKCSMWKLYKENPAPLTSILYMVGLYFYSGRLPPPADKQLIPICCVSVTLEQFMSSWNKIATRGCGDDVQYSITAHYMKHNLLAFPQKIMHPARVIQSSSPQCHFSGLLSARVTAGECRVHYTGENRETLWMSHHPVYAIKACSAGQPCLYYLYYLITYI